MKDKSSHINLSSTRIPATLLLPICLLGLAGHCQASTLVSGNISGTWTKTNSPYVVIGNCTVPCGQILTIQPGVTVIIGENLGIDVLGQILSVGTVGEQITIKGSTPTNRWTRVYVKHGCGAESQFRYCKISDAETGLYLHIYAENAAMTTTVANCSFSNCSSAGICGDSEGWGYVDHQLSGSYNYYFQPSFNASISNCRFAGSQTGCRFIIHGTYWWDYNSGGHYAVGYANPSIANCIIENVTATGIAFQTGNYPGNSTAKVVNCLLSQCANGVVNKDPYDVTVWNNIITGCGVGVQRTGSLSSQVGYNCFFNNQTDFAGYPVPPFGQIVMANNNGTPCDIAYNILQNPMFVDTTNYYLLPGSPCVDGGDSAVAYGDCSLGSPFSLGTIVNDMGPYGGPGACAWITAPVISCQPRSVSSCLGQSATFFVCARGTQLSYQWWFNGTPLTGQTSTNLVLTNLQRTNAGAYWVVVTNSAGRATTDMAQLNVFDACVDICMYSGLWISGEVGRTYVLKYTTDLNNTNFDTWTPLATNVLPATNWFWLDMESCGSGKRFYGVKLVP